MPKPGSGALLRGSKSVVYHQRSSILRLLGPKTLLYKAFRAMLMLRVGRVQ